MDLQGKVVLITGASGGIGAATARAFAAAGSKVALVSRSEPALRRLQAEIGESGAFVAPADVRRREDVDNAIDRTVAHFGAVDIAVNNAGVGIGGRIADLRWDLFLQAIETNLIGPLHVIQAVVPVMRASGSGLIVNVSSMITSVSVAGSGAYRATKVGLDAISDAVRIELRRDGIRVVTIYPGLTATGFFNNSLGLTPGRTPGIPRRARPPQLVALKIVKAARAEPRAMYMGLRGRIATIAAGLFPGLLERVAAK